ncbi:MAG: NADH-quinone oxidoreductase subunit NuoK [Chloroflexi bacterium]|nr:NADH-quinone oxidoreductase subunit NuoK [Chloroflexota bacterium]
MTLQHFLVLSAVIFSIGLYGALAKRNVVAVLMCIELMFNAVNITLVAFARYLPATAGNPYGPLTGQVFALFIIAVAAAEAAVALAIILAVYRTRRSVNVEDVNLLQS